MTILDFTLSVKTNVIVVIIIIIINSVGKCKYKGKDAVPGIEAVNKPIGKK